MNILFVVHYPELYGSIRSIIDLINGLQKYDINAYFVVSREGSLTKLLTKEKIPYCISPIPWWVSENDLSIRQKGKVLYDMLESSKVLTKLANNWDIDLIYTNSSVTPVGRLTAWCASIPHIWHIREFGDLDFSLKFIFPKLLSRIFIRSSDAIIFHAQKVRDYWFKTPKKNIYQIYNGSATLDQFKVRLERRKAEKIEGAFAFSMLSFLSPKKGQEYAIRAIAALKQNGCHAKLLLAGNGKEQFIAYLKHLAKDLRVADSIDFLGHIDDPYPVYFASDCALVCSDYEAFSRVGLEAMSTALPVIGKNSGGNPEIITHEVTGLLYNTFDELVESMIRMVENPNWAHQLGLAGWQRAKEKFNIEDYAANVYNVIQSVVKGS